MKQTLHILIAMAMLLMAGCKNLESKNINAAADANVLKIGASPDNAGFNIGIGRTAWTWQSASKDHKNSVQIKYTESSAWYCASIKEQAIIVSITSDSPIALDWPAIMNTKQVTQDGVK